MAKVWIVGILVAATPMMVNQAEAQGEKKPNIVMLMMDDVGRSDFGAYPGGGKALGHPTPNIDQLVKGGRAVYELVRPVELHRRPVVLHHRPHPDPQRPIGGRGAR